MAPSGHRSFRTCSERCCSMLCAVSRASLPVAACGWCFFASGWRASSAFRCLSVQDPVNFVAPVFSGWRSVFFKRVLCCGLELHRQSCGLVALLLDGCVPKDDADCDATTVANPPGFQRLIRRWKADSLRVGNLPSQGAAVTTCRHLPAKGLRI